MFWGLICGHLWRSITQVTTGLVQSHLMILGVNYLRRRGRDKKKRKKEWTLQMYFTLCIFSIVFYKW